jgi:serine/threonine protein phosphatase PrpC
MTARMDEHEQRRALDIGYRRAELTLEQLWLRYFALGGVAGLVEVEAYLHGVMSLPPLQRDILAHAVNERLDELTWRHRVPYSRSAREGRPASGPLAALVALLEGMRLAPPERLPVAAAAAGRALGIEVVIYLVDYEQRLLTPVTTADGPAREPCAVEATLPGRAFRQVEILPSEAGGTPRLWVPLLDGVERLGVLEVVMDDAADLYDGVLRQQCQWVSGLLGHLVVAVDHYGDALDTARRQRSRSPAAELVWHLLPSLTAGTDRCVLSGLVEPSYEVGGDAFDYALSETTAHLAIFDAVGHSLTSGIVAAVALAAYRSTRRGGGSLFAQATAIEDALAEAFGNESRFITGVLAELDLVSGRLRYLAAGHPYPLLMRDGRVVKSLTGGRRTLFGLPTANLSVAEEFLEPGDWLILYTDGITEARDEAGNFFGEERLVDFLRREAASDHPPPETVRRLVHAVMRHQRGVLQDDATVLLARWDRSGQVVTGTPGEATAGR